MDLRLHALISPQQVPQVDLQPWLQEAAAGGVTVVQLRAKRGSTREILDYGQELANVCRSLRLPLVVNDRLDLALALEADMLHVGPDDLPPYLVRRVAPRIGLGCSARNLQELEALLQEKPDYIGFGPVFATASKDDAGPVQGVQVLRQAVRMAHGCPLVAIGGIGPGNQAEVWATGVAGIAVISALSEAADVRAAAHAMLPA